MGIIELSIVYGLTTSLLRGSLSMIISSFLFLADFALGIYLFDVSWILTAKAVFAAWMALNFGLAVRFLRPVLKHYFTKKENLEDAE